MLTPAGIGNHAVRPHSSSYRLFPLLSVSEYECHMPSFKVIGPGSGEEDF